MRKQAPSFKIPLIDFSKFMTARNASEKQQTATEIVKGFKEVGFIYLDKHGIPDTTVKNAFAKVICSAPFPPTGPEFDHLELCLDGGSIRDGRAEEGRRSPPRPHPPSIIFMYRSVDVRRHCKPKGDVWARVVADLREEAGDGVRAPPAVDRPQRSVPAMVRTVDDISVRDSRLAALSSLWLG